jgi:hypothetical protein
VSGATSVAHLADRTGSTSLQWRSTTNELVLSSRARFIVPPIMSRFDPPNTQSLYFRQSQTESSRCSSCDAFSREVDLNDVTMQGHRVNAVSSGCALPSRRQGVDLGVSDDASLCIAKPSRATVLPSLDVLAQSLLRSPPIRAHHALPKWLKIGERRKGGRLVENPRTGRCAHCGDAERMLSRLSCLINSWMSCFVVPQCSFQASLRCIPPQRFHPRPFTRPELPLIHGCVP